MLLAEMAVAIAILVIALLPLGYAAGFNARLFRANYERAVAMEIVDGEMEILAAGEWRAFPEGPQPYAVHAKAAASLPPGNSNSPAPATIFACNGPPPKSAASAPSSGR